MSRVPIETRLRLNRQSVEHSVRTAVAAIASLTVARVLKLPEAYWATITTLIIMQSTLGATWAISAQRFAGTSLGAVMGALVATYLGQSVVTFGAAVLVAGLVCCLLAWKGAPTGMPASLWRSLLSLCGARLHGWWPSIALLKSRWVSSWGWQ